MFLYSCRYHNSFTSRVLHSVQCYKLQVKQPILFLSGLQDEMVPPSHMEMLYAKASARNRQCLFVDFPSGMHMDTWLSGGDRYWRTVRDFLERVVSDKKDCGPFRGGKF